jgi:alcohol dehydrogenase class IV
MPTPASVAELSQRLIEDRVDVVVAVGGGAVMDAAKAAAALAAGEIRPDAKDVLSSCAVRMNRAPRALVVAVPTTPGTGAEVTPFATVWDYEGGRKLSVCGPAVRPAAAVLDPELLGGLPVRVLVGAALDSIAQGAEAAWSRRATQRSTELGMKAVSAVGNGLAELAAGTLISVRLLELQWAGHLSGQALSLTPTTSVHAVSYALTLRHGLAHGHACGVAFGRIADFNAGVTAADCAHPWGAARTRRVLGDVAAALGFAPYTMAAQLDRLLVQAGMECLDDLRIDPVAVAAEAEAYPRCHDNPRRFDGRLADLLAPRTAGC